MLCTKKIIYFADLKVPGSLKFLLLSSFFYLQPLSLELILKKCQALHFYVRAFSRVKFNFVDTLWAFQLAMLIYWISPKHWPQHETCITFKINNFHFGKSFGYGFYKDNLYIFSRKIITLNFTCLCRYFPENKVNTKTDSGKDAILAIYFNPSLENKFRYFHPFFWKQS